jgi:FMN-dependent NADH-azoreductase
MKPTLLVIDSSGRNSRSLTRRLTRRFAESWQNHHPNGTVVHRDVGQNPPPPVDERWIAAAFAPLENHTREMGAALQLSDSLIDELVAADCVVFGAPIYNFGMPAQLKAYFDQIVRVRRTFAFAPGDAEPYRPLLASKPVIVVTAAGDGSMHPGGALYHLNHLEPHLLTVFNFIGLRDATFVRVGYDEFQDDRLKRSLSAAEQSIDELASAMSLKFAEENFPQNPRMSIAAVA